MATQVNDEQDYTCPICLELLLRPVKLSCDHRFCRGCWARVLQSRDVRATARLTGSAACPYRCEVKPVVPEVDQTLASQLESHFAEYRERASSTSLPDEERRSTEVNEWAARGCTPAHPRVRRLVSEAAIPRSLSPPWPSPSRQNTHSSAAREGLRLDTGDEVATNAEEAAAAQAARTLWQERAVQRLQPLHRLRQERVVERLQTVRRLQAVVRLQAAQAARTLRQARAGERLQAVKRLQAVERLKMAVIIISVVGAVRAPLPLGAVLLFALSGWMIGTTLFHPRLASHPVTMPALFALTGLSAAFVLLDTLLAWRIC